MYYINKSSFKSQKLQHKKKCTEGNNLRQTEFDYHTTRLVSYNRKTRQQAYKDIPYHNLAITYTGCFRNISHYTMNSYILNSMKSIVRITVQADHAVVCRGILEHGRTWYIN